MSGPTPNEAKGFTPEPDANATAYREDGVLINMLSGMGMGKRDRSTQTRVGSPRFLTQQELESLYTVGLPRRFVDAIPDETLKHAATLKLSTTHSHKEQEFIQSFDQHLRELRFAKAYAEAMRLQRLYGGAALLMYIDDGQEADQPVNYNAIKSIDGFEALSRYELQADSSSGHDLSNPTFYRLANANTRRKSTPITPSRWTGAAAAAARRSRSATAGGSHKVPVAGTSGASSTKGNASGEDLIEAIKPSPTGLIHKSRVARFDGLFLPYAVRQTNGGWGQSSLQLVWDGWRRYETVVSGLEGGILDSSQAYHKIPGLRKMVTDGQASLLFKRMEVNNAMRSMYGTMAIDAEEEMGFSERRLSSLQYMMTPFSEYMQATTGWPAPILMGVSPGGLGRDGRFEERVWASIVESWLITCCLDSVHQVFDCILRCKDTPWNGSPPKNWEVKFPNTYSTTPLEDAQLQLTQGQAASTWHGLGVLGTMELRESHFGPVDFNQSVTLDDSLSEIIKETAMVKAKAALAQAQLELDQAENPLAPPEDGSNGISSDPTSTSAP